MSPGPWGLTGPLRLVVFAACCSSACRPFSAPAESSGRFTFPSAAFADAGSPGTPSGWGLACWETCGVALSATERKRPACLPAVGLASFICREHGGASNCAGVGRLHHRADLHLLRRLPQLRERTPPTCDAFAKAWRTTPPARRASRPNDGGCDLRPRHLALEPDLLHECGDRRLHRRRAGRLERHRGARPCVPGDRRMQGDGCAAPCLRRAKDPAICPLQRRASRRPAGVRVRQLRRRTLNIELRHRADDPSDPRRLRIPPHRPTTAQDALPARIAPDLLVGSRRRADSTTTFVHGTSARRLDRLQQVAQLVAALDPDWRGPSSRGAGG